MKNRIIKVSKKNVVIKVFTPIEYVTGERLKFKRSSVKELSGSIDTRGENWTAMVKIKGRRYVVWGIPCNLIGCNCDATALEIFS